MKGFPTLLIVTALLALAGCGRQNESGRNGQNGPCLAFGASGCNQFGALPSGINFNLAGNQNISQIIGQIPCEIAGGFNLGQGNGIGIGRLQPVTLQVATQTITTAGQAYLGVSSMGDIAIIVGSGSTNAQATIFACQGQMIGPQNSQILLGEFVSPSCPIKTITVANFGGVPFRDPKGGRGVNGPSFNFCQRAF